MPNIAKWRKIPPEEFEQMVAESHSYRELARKLGYSQDGGGTIQSLKRGVEERGLDTSHFTGQAWNKENYYYDSFTENSPKKRGKTIVDPLIKLRGRKCEKCGLTEWLGEPINLQVHHIDGDRTNNSLDNLILLCPNCHSYTPNYCKSTGKMKVPEEDFVAALKDSPNIHQALKKIGLTPAAGNYTRARELITKYEITSLY